MYHTKTAIDAYGHVDDGGGSALQLPSHASRMPFKVFMLACRSLPGSWSQMQQMARLYLDHNALTGRLPEAWGGNKTFPSLVAANLVRLCDG